MKCCDCKYHESGYLWNHCCLTGNEYYYEFYKEQCPFITDDYKFKEDVDELGFKKDMSTDLFLK